MKRKYVYRALTDGLATGLCTFTCLPLLGGQVTTISASYLQHFFSRHRTLGTFHRGALHVITDGMATSAAEWEGFAEDTLARQKRIRELVDEKGVEAVIEAAGTFCGRCEARGREGRGGESRGGEAGRGCMPALLRQVAFLLPAAELRPMSARLLRLCESRRRQEVQRSMIFLLTLPRMWR